MRQLLGLASVIALLAAPIAAQAATMATEGNTLTITGAIERGDRDAFNGRIALDGNDIKVVRLNSPGGLLVEGMAIADIIQARHLNTAVAENGMCASACFLLFAAGDHKTVGRNARIGVHSATSTRGVGPDDGNGTLLMARYAAQLGVPAAIVGRMVETDSINIHWLEDADLREMGATMAIPPAETGAYLHARRHPKPEGLAERNEGLIIGSSLPRFALIQTAPQSAQPVAKKPWQ